jgi:hypothetical protein
MLSLEGIEILISTTADGAARQDVSARAAKMTYTLRSMIWRNLPDSEQGAFSDLQPNWRQ